MRLHKCILIGVVLSCAVSLASPQLSFACWFTGENTYECCMVCCQDSETCQDYLSGDGLRATGCSFNFYCLWNPVYCSRSCLEMEVCPFGLILDDDQSKLDVLREIRDTRLLNTPLGESLVDLYYYHAEEVLTILLSDEDLLAITANITDAIVENAQEVTGSEVMVIDGALLESIVEVADLVDQEASLELKKTLQMLRRAIKKKVMFRKLGIAINE